MKLIYLIAGTYRPAGMERVLALKAGYFASRGDDVLIVTTDQRGRPHAFDMDPAVRTMDLGIGYELSNGRPFLVKAIGHPFRLLLHRWRLGRLLRREKADVVVSMFCNDASFVPCIKDGSMKVLELHFSRFKLLQYSRKGLWALADRLRSRRLGKIASRFDRFVVLTEEDRKYWLEDFPELEGRISVIPNPSGCAPEDFPGYDPSRRTVLAAGRYCDQKNFDDLIEAWKMIPADLRSGWTLRIAGDGPLYDRLALKASAAGNVVLGPSADMASEYASSAVFALSSRYEGLPMVLLEAQTAGLPIVSYGCKCGPRDVVVDGEDGYIVPEGDVKALSERLSQLLSDASLRSSMSSAAMLSAGRFSSGRILPMWEELFSPVRPRTVVVSAVNIRKGGTLKILRQTLSYLSERRKEEDLDIVALVHRKELCDYPGIRYIELPWCIRSWAHRLWAEYVTMHRISLDLKAARGGAAVDVWLSLHDTSPRVVARRQEVYCHTSFPFLKVRAMDFLMDPKIPLFALLGRFAYRVNVGANDSIIVQQEWFAEAMSSLLHVPRERFRVIRPEGGTLPRPQDLPSPSRGSVPTFLYVSTADCHKNFETLLEASACLERRLGKGKFRTVITVAGDENRYAAYLFRHWGTVDSVEFRGKVAYDALWTLYASADVFVFPSRIETWGLPISEYGSVRPDGKMLLSDLPYAHETASGYDDVKYFSPLDVQGLSRLMYESIADR